MSSRPRRRVGLLGGTFDPIHAAHLAVARAVLEKMLEIHGSRYANLSEIEATLEIVRRGGIQPVITDVVALEEIEAIHEKLLNREISGRVVAEF